MKENSLFGFSHSFENQDGELLNLSSVWICVWIQFCVNKSENIKMGNERNQPKTDSLLLTKT